MLQPKRQKYRKQFRGKRTGTSLRSSQIDFGEYGLQALENCWLTARQIEAARKAVNHYLKRSGKLWIRVFPDKPITKKPAGAHMGGGKGDIDTYVAVVKKGKIIFELAGISLEIAEEALRRAGHKLPIKTKFISKTITSY